MRNTQDVARDPLRESTLPAETATMRVPPRNRWQVLLLEYELLDNYWDHLHQRIWVSGLVLIGLSMVGLAFLSTVLERGQGETLQTIGLVGGAASLLTLGWWLLLRRMFSLQGVAEYRRREIERELGMRSETYLHLLRQSRLFGRRRLTGVARRAAEGDEEMEFDLREFGSSAEARPWFPRIMAERWVWLAMPWLLVGAWGALYWIKL